jgi:eukaryotic-like serine/threonine-protein kinase
MASAEWDQVLEIFHAAREKSGFERTALLDTACGEKTPLRKAVEELLKEDEAAEGFLSTPVFESISGEVCESLVVPGQHFGRYVIGELLGSGGMGEVWSARDTALDRPVALKFLSSKALAVLDTDQLIGEAKAASALNHPNIVTIHEVVQSESTLAIVMELVEGVPFRQLAGEPLPTAELLEIASQIARALAAAHAGDIVHGDIKPENILLRRDRYVKVQDFGLARKVNTETIASAGQPGLRHTSLYVSGTGSRRIPDSGERCLFLRLGSL